MKKLKVLHIITRLDKGGSSENTLLTCIGLDKGRFAVTLLAGETVNPDKALLAEAKSRGLNFIFLPELVRRIRPFKDIKAVFKIYSIIKREKFDIVHSHSSKAGFIGRLAAKLAGVKIIIYTPHGHIFYGYFNWFVSRIFILLEKLSAGYTNRIITLTEKGREEHLKLKIAAQEKFTVIHSGIRVDKFFCSNVDIDLKKRQLDLPKNHLLIGTVGRLVPIKGHFYLISAMKYLLKEIPEAVLLIIGEGRLKDRLEKQVKRMNLSPAIRFLNFQDNIQDVLSILDLFVLPSLNEGMGRVIVEAQLSRLPVVAARVGGIPDLVIDGITGFLVSPAEPEILAQAMIKILKNRELANKMGENGEKRALQKFSFKLMVEKIQGLYDELLAEKGVFL